MVNLPYLGEIPETKQTNKLVVVENNRDNMAEAFRIVRSNVEFLNSKIQTNCKVVFITSTIGKEGKSFIALNLAASFALTGKKYF
jgi:Mrp family chromosome partitioning ATPase